MRVLSFILAVALVLIGNTHAQADDPSLIERIDSWVEGQRVANNFPGLALVIVQDGEILHTQGYGSDGNGNSFTADTPTYVASLTKSLTAVAVLQLVDAGAIELDARVSDYLPDFVLAVAGEADLLTIRMCLNQITGLSDATFNEQAINRERGDLASVIAQMNTAHLASPPGTTHAYHNPNYWILGRVVEVVTGQPFTTYVEENILAPMGMNDSDMADWSDTREPVPNAAKGHLFGFGFPGRFDPDVALYASSGGLITTANDYGRYLLMQLNEGRVNDQQIVSPDSLRLAHTRPEIGTSYGMGWYVYRVETVNGPIPYLSHSGDLGNFHTNAVLLPEMQGGTGFALLYNVGSYSANEYGFPLIVNGVTALLAGDALPPADPINARGIGTLIGLLTLIFMLPSVIGLLRLRHWRMKNAGRSWLRLLPTLLSPWIGVVIFALLPVFALLVSGRGITHELLFYVQPDLVIGTGIVAVFGALNGIAYLLTALRDRQKHSSTFAAPLSAA